MSRELSPSQLHEAAFYCDLCGDIAATVYFVPPMEMDPRFVDAGPDLPPGVGTIGQENPRVSIDGGPVSVTISVAKERVPAVAAALASKDITGLRAVDSEFAPFWCFRCEKSYCRKHWKKRTVFDEGFFDYIEGLCPMNHRQILAD